ncbi:hypothetical protein LguiA_003693 [Lonicera macranthoides]
MEIVVLPCKSIPPITTPSKHESLAEFSPKHYKPSVNFSNNHLKLSSKPNSIITDTHLNHLCYKHRLNEAIVVLDSIAQYGFKVKPNTFARLIQTCIDMKSINLGREFHKRIDLVNVTPFIEAKLVSMYAKCGSLEDARKVFDEIRERNLFTWSAMVGACSRDERWREVVDLFFSMMEDGVVPDNFLFPKILKACGNCGDVEACKLIHSMVIRCGMKHEIRVNNSVLGAYSKCRMLDSARRFFENMEWKDDVSWNSVITAYCNKGDVGEAQRFFELMLKEGIEPGLRTWNIMIACYNQLGSCDIAMEMMKEMKSFGITPDVFTWTSMISGLAQNNRRIEALELFRRMLLEGTKPNGVTLTSAISACASLKDLYKGKELHSIAFKTGCADSVLVGNSLIDIYSKCGELEAAQLVFDSVLEKDFYTWNSMIGGYCQAGYCGKAHDLFMKMQESGLLPNVVTWNAMITGYMQKGAEDQAMILFDIMEKDGKVKRDAASWNTLIAGYLQNGQKNKALEIFRQMQSLNVKPNSVTLLTILPSLANLVSAKKVQEIHGCVMRWYMESDLSVSNSLVDTYAKSGNLVYSKAVFDEMPTKDIVSWNILIGGFVLHGRPFDALHLFDKMREMAVEPSKGTFARIISAYGLAKMVDEGKRIFSSMIEEYQILPCLDHCAAMVNLYGRSGRFEEAIAFIEDMPIEPDFSVWVALLTACRIRGNFKLAALAGERLLELQPKDTVLHQLVSELHALCGIAKDSLEVKMPERWKENKENVGQSWIEVKNRVYTFVSGDQCHPNAELAYSRIRSIGEKFKGFDSFRMFCFDEEESEEICGVHSEKLAFAFSLTKSPHASKTIRIVKNLRMCTDCHFTAKVISKAYGCDVYVSDSSCLHHFRDGRCSCGDYW